MVPDPNLQTLRDGQVLIVSNTGDAHSDFLVRACTARGYDCFRWNTDRFRASGTLQIDLPGDTGILEIDGHRCDLHRVRLLIYRRPDIYHRARSDIEPWVGKLLDAEWQSIENALSYLVPGIVMNPLAGSALAQNKLIQLRAAHSVGLSVPATLVATDADALKRFAALGDCITKGITNAFVVSDGVLRSGHTSAIKPNDLADFQALGCPTLLQAAIRPAAYWRAVVVGERVFGFRLHGPALREEVDSRKIDQHLQGTAANLPIETAQHLLALCRKLSIVFASSDFLEDESGRLWFIDLNPEGQWAYLEQRFGTPLADAIVQLGTSA